jgi:hypothetical protein
MARINAGEVAEGFRAGLGIVRDIAETRAIMQEREYQRQGRQVLGQLQQQAGQVVGRLQQAQAELEAIKGLKAAGKEFDPKELAEAEGNVAYQTGQTIKELMVLSGPHMMSPYPNVRQAAVAMFRAGAEGADALSSAVVEADRQEFEAGERAKDRASAERQSREAAASRIAAAKIAKEPPELTPIQKINQRREAALSIQLLLDEGMEPEDIDKLLEGSGYTVENTQGRYFKERDAVAKKLTALDKEIKKYEERAEAGEDVAHQLAVLHKEKQQILDKERKEDDKRSAFREKYLGMGTGERLLSRATEGLLKLVSPGSLAEPMRGSDYEGGG